MKKGCFLETKLNSSQEELTRLTIRYTFLDLVEFKVDNPFEKALEKCFSDLKLRAVQGNVRFNFNSKVIADFTRVSMRQNAYSNTLVSFSLNGFNLSREAVCRLGKVPFQLPRLGFMNIIDAFSAGHAELFFATLFSHGMRNNEKLRVTRIVLRMTMHPQLVTEKCAFFAHQVLRHFVDDETCSIELFPIGRDARHKVTQKQVKYIILARVKQDINLFGILKKEVTKVLDHSNGAQDYLTPAQLNGL